MKFINKMNTLRSKKIHAFIVIFTCLSADLNALDAVAAEEKTKTEAIKYTTVQLNTDLGDIWIRLNREKAPITTANFLGYVDSGFYNGTIFHRVMANFMAQGGGYTANFVRKETRDPIINESTNGLKNTRGSIAMARLADPNSANAQFFINLKHNVHLDAVLNREFPRLGYTVFGEVIKGMDVVEKIVAEPQGIYRRYPNAPNAPVRIHSAKRAALPKSLKAESPISTTPISTTPATATPIKTTPIKTTPIKTTSNSNKLEKTNKSAEQALEEKPADNPKTAD